MPTYNVHLTQTISSTVTVEADSPEAAIDLASDSDDFPGSMVHGAFGTANVDEAGAWDAVLVTNANGDEVWSENAEAAK